MDTLNKAEKFWDRAAKYYDKEEKKDYQTYIHIITKTRKYLKPGDVVLDYGCGTGLVSNEIADNVALIHAVDISSKMIEIAKRKAIERGIQNIDYAYSTVFDDRYKKGSFNVILAFHILHLLDNPQKLMQRMIELLKPGGFIISATPCLGEKPVLNSVFSIACKLGIMPKIRPFKFPDLKQLFTTEILEIIETENLHKKLEQYFIVAKKH